MKIHAPLLPLAVCMIVGIATSQWINDWFMPLVALVIVVIATCMVGRYPRLQTAGILLGALLLGMTLGSRQRQQLDVEWPEEKQQVELVVTSEVKVKEKTVVFDALTADGQHKLRCNIRRDQDSEQIQIGQGILVDSRIKKVHDYHHGHFDYLQYMQCHGYTGELYAYSNQWHGQSVSLKELSMTDRLRLRFLTWRHQLLEHFSQQQMDEDAQDHTEQRTEGHLFASGSSTHSGTERTAPDDHLWGDNHGHWLAPLPHGDTNHNSIGNMGLRPADRTVNQRGALSIHD